MMSNSPSVDATQVFAIGVLVAIFLRLRSRASPPRVVIDAPQNNRPQLEISIPSFEDPPRPSSVILRSPSSGTPKVYNGVGGHAKKNRGLPLLFMDGYLLKPLQDENNERSRGEFEAQFYQKVWSTNHPLKHCQPHFYGVETMENGVRYLCLQDLTYGMEQACVLDLKMGRRSYGETASPEKVAKERAKYPPQEAVGFRFAGMRCFVSGELVESTREWCFGLQIGDIPDALERFFFDGKQIRRALVRSLVDQVQDIVHCLDKFPTWRMYGASLLVCYDAKQSGGEVQCKLIDFANVYEINDRGGKDYGFLHGLYFLLSSLNIILDRGRRNLTKRGSVVDNSSRLIAMMDNSPNSLERDPHFVPVLRKKESMRTLSPALSSISSSRRVGNTSSSLAFQLTPPKEEEEENTSSSEAEEEIVHVGESDEIDFTVVPLVLAPLQREEEDERVPFQVGGAHENIFCEDGTVYKQQVDAASFEAECAFYESITEKQDALVRITPLFMGVDSKDDGATRCMMLEDVSTLVLSADDTMVNIMDVKLGFRSFRLDCSNEAKASYFEKYMQLQQTVNNKKRAAACGLQLASGQCTLGKRDYLAFRDATTTSKECGFRLTALKHAQFAVSQEESRTVDTLEEFTTMLERFLHSTRGTFDSELCAGFIEEMQSVIECFEESTKFAESDFVGTSLLLLHCNGVPVIRWIDFANVCPKHDGNGVVFGARLLIHVLESLLNKQAAMSVNL